MLGARLRGEIACVMPAARFLGQVANSEEYKPSRRRSAPIWPRRNSQNVKRIASCTCRGLLAEKIRPNVAGSSTYRFGKLKLEWLRTLNT